MSMPPATGRGRRLFRVLPVVTLLVCVPACAPQVVQGNASPAAPAMAGGSPDRWTPPTDRSIPPPSSGPTTPRTATPRTTTPPPAPAPEPIPTPAGVERFLGVGFSDPDLQTYLGRCAPRSGSWLCPYDSTEIVVSSYGRVTAVLMISPEVASGDGYTPALPFGISFADSPEELMAQLGPPADGQAAPDHYLEWQIDDRELTVHFMPQPPLRIGHVRMALI